MATKLKTKPKKLTKTEQYCVDFHATVKKLAKTRKRPFTVDDVTAKIGTPPQGGKALGALMNASATRYNLVQVGTQRSLQPSRRGALNRTWKAE
jgi:hypothetical protein